MSRTTLVVVGALLAGVTWRDPAAPSRPGPTSPADSTRVVVLGTGTPNNDPDRSGPALAVIANGTAYLVDAGPGIVRRAAGAEAKGIKALEVTHLDKLFVTHLHSDHTVGLPDLIFSPWVLERTAPLSVWGPPGIKAMTDHLEEAYAADVDNRINGKQPQNKTGYRVIAREVQPGVIYRDSNVTVRAFAVPHANWKVAYGYRFDAPGRSIVVSGDTHPSDAVVRACNGCDVLVHEVYSAEMLRKRPPEWQRYHADAHTSTTELASIATRAHPKLLVLYHQIFWGTDDAGLIREIRAAGYTGAVVSAKDLGVY